MKSRQNSEKTSFFKNAPIKEYIWNLEKLRLQKKRQFKLNTCQQQNERRHIV